MNARDLVNPLPDMCETCESAQREGKAGHHTHMAVAAPGCAAMGRVIWFCSPRCYQLSPVPIYEFAPNGVPKEYEYLFDDA
jgi:hypothetical protein